MTAGLEVARRTAGRGEGGSAHRSIHNPGERHRRVPGRHDRRRRGRAHDADADPPVRGDALDSDIERPRRCSGDAARRSCSAPHQRHCQQGPRRLDGARARCRWRSSAHTCSTSSATRSPRRSRSRWCSGWRCSSGRVRWCCAPRWAAAPAGAQRRRRRAGGPARADDLMGMIGGDRRRHDLGRSGSLMIIMLLFLYPMSGRQLVGTDLTQAVPLTIAAAAERWRSATSSSVSRSP